MNAVITFNEISDFIEKRFSIRPEFTAIDRDTFEVSYKPSLFMPVVVVKFHVVAVGKDAVCISYDCGMAASIVIAGAVAYLQEKIPSGVEVDTSAKRMIIYPQRFKQIEKALEYVSLSDIAFEDDSVNVALSMA